MIETTERLLSLLSVLQARPVWTGPQLAEHLGVTVRTIRRDVERLRSLGYAIESVIGATGGYRLGVGGTVVPPLMLDEEEAVAVAVCLRSAAIDTVAGAGDAAARALSKLEQMMPSRLRPQLAAIGAATMRLPSEGTAIDSATFVTVSRACRERVVLRIEYRDREGRATERRVEPYRAVNAGRRWYLVARDQEAARRPADDGWRTLRLDRVATAEATGHRFDRVDAPDPVALVQRSITTSPYAHQARIEIGAPIMQLAEQVPSTVGVLEAIDEHTTMMTTGAEDLDLVALHVARMGLPFVVHEPAALRARLIELGHLLVRDGARIPPA